MSWWKRKKCGICKKVLKKNKKTSNLEMQTADGPVQYEVCEDCSKFFDALTEVLEREYSEDE